jgi:hypothetical protein
MTPASQMVMTIPRSSIVNLPTGSNGSSILRSLDGIGGE